MSKSLAPELTPEYLLKTLASLITENYDSSRTELLTDENFSTVEYMACIRSGIMPKLENPPFKERFKILTDIFRRALSDITDLPVISPYMKTPEYEEGFAKIKKGEGWLTHESNDVELFLKNEPQWSITAVRMLHNVPQEAYGYFPFKKKMMIAKIGEGTQEKVYSNEDDGLEKITQKELHTSKSIPSQNMVIPRYPKDASDHLLAAPFRIAFYQTEQDIEIHMVNSVLSRAYLIASGEVDFGYDVEFIHGNNTHRIPRAILAASELFIQEAGGYCCNLDGKIIDYSRDRPDGSGYLMCNTKENAPGLLERINGAIDRKSLLMLPEELPDLQTLLAPRRPHKKR